VGQVGENLALRHGANGASEIIDAWGGHVPPEYRRGEPGRWPSWRTRSGLGAPA